jgi:hypothetical protein
MVVLVQELMKEFMEREKRKQKEREQEKAKAEAVVDAAKKKGRDKSDTPGKETEKAEAKA